MAEAGDTYNSIYQNLIDAGCDENITENCMSFVTMGVSLICFPFSLNIENACLIQYTKFKSKQTVWTI